MPDNRSNWRPYLDYLMRLADERDAKGNDASDVADDQYWNERRRNEALKDLPLKKAA